MRHSAGEKTFIGFVLFAIFMQGLALWVGASAITSGIKALSDSCGKRYGIEVVVGGDWFCPEDE